LIQLAAQQGDPLLQGLEFGEALGIAAKPQPLGHQEGADDHNRQQAADGDGHTEQKALTQELLLGAHRSLKIGHGSNPSF
jgi:hypothetical protein